MRVLIHILALSFLANVSLAYDPNGFANTGLNPYCEVEWNHYMQTSEHFDVVWALGEVYYIPEDAYMYMWSSSDPYGAALDIMDANDMLYQASYYYNAGQSTQGDLALLFADALLDDANDKIDDAHLLILTQ